ncbi:hypothetical protein L6452_02755 [Arctium lappa]|uniref:Uncharacterized protein n=1 Tax=Arctium lappa TaxID=4217 RepID=A0ACB9FKF3_ARCLA|nr:hypothetical protein L6452_02755 [Arctium lappa]
MSVQRKILLPIPQGEPQVNRTKHQSHNAAQRDMTVNSRSHDPYPNNKGILDLRQSAASFDSRPTLTPRHLQDHRDTPTVTYLLPFEHHRTVDLITASRPPAAMF